MKSKHWLAFAAAIALATGLGAACGDGPEEEQDLCENVQCVDAATTCDPADGQCKCGTGDDKIICKSDEICQTEPAPSCLQDACVGVTCDRGETCDPTDGVCKCGASSCSEGEVCSQNRCSVPDPCLGLLCAEGQTCDSEDGACKCGGEICGEDERCDDGLCVKDPCKGVHCGGLSVCNPEDLACHCGTVTGEVCASGQSCAEVAGDFICESIDRCADRDCQSGTVCDPSDGECRCGGIGPEHPICLEDQTCHDGECVGGNLCSGVVCAPGFVCDEDTGNCLCGDRMCAEGETCMAMAIGGGDDDDDATPETRFECVQECDPFDPAACPPGNACYIDLSIGASVGYCHPEGSTAINEECTFSHDCNPTGTCYGTDERICRLFCEEGAAGDAYCGSEYDRCVVPGGAAGNIGICFKFP